MIKTINLHNFNDEVINNNKPILLDFWASWCGPCMMLSPTLDELAEESNAFDIGKINVDEQPELAQKFGISSIPTLIFMENGEILKKSVGLMSKNELKMMLGI